MPNELVFFFQLASHTSHHRLGVNAMLKEGHQ